MRQPGLHERQQPNPRNHRPRRLVTSVAIGTDGNPVISHEDDTNDDLEVAVPVFTVTGIAFE